MQNRIVRWLATPAGIAVACAAGAWLYLETAFGIGFGGAPWVACALGVVAVVVFGLPAWVDLLRRYAGQPKTDIVQPKETPKEGKMSRGLRQAKNTPTDQTSGNLWLLGGDGRLRRISLELGLNDGQFTQVKDSIQEGQEVVTGYAGGAPKSSTGQSPFGSPFGGGPRRF